MWALCSVHGEDFSLRALASKSLVREFSQHAHCLILVVAVASYWVYLCHLQAQGRCFWVLASTECIFCLPPALSGFCQKPFKSSLLAFSHLILYSVSSESFKPGNTSWESPKESSQVLQDVAEVIKYIAFFLWVSPESAHQRLSRGLGNQRQAAKQVCFHMSCMQVSPAHRGCQPSCSAEHFLSIG